MTVEKINKQIEIVNGDSREAIEDLMDTNPSLCNKVQVAIIEMSDNALFEKLMKSQHCISDEAIIKIFTMDDIMKVKLFGRCRKEVSEDALFYLYKELGDVFVEKYVEYARQVECEDFVEAMSREVEYYPERLDAIFGEGNTGYSIREF